MKKALIVATVGGFIDFEKNNIELLESLGYEVHVACSADGWEEYLVDVKQKVIDVRFDRNPTSINNISAYKRLKQLIREEKYQLIHCHTPIAGVLTRFAARKVRKQCKVIYTAHGFHFYKGAPTLNWLIYYPVEWVAAWFTDILITINTEDYGLAKKRLHAKNVEYVPGVGMDVNAIKNITIDRNDVRKQLGLKPQQKMLLSVGEINDNKNHRIIIESLAKMRDKSIMYYIAGTGTKQEALLQLSRDLGVSEQVHFLGYRKDILALDLAADVFCFPSYREGLSVALMEAIARETIVVCSNIRGNRDLAEGNDNVFLFNVNSIDSCIQSIIKALSWDYVENKSIEKFSVKEVSEKMCTIYRTATRN